MEIIFVKTEEFKEFEDSIKKCIKILKQNTLTILLGGFLMYLSLVLFIICI